MRPPVAPVYAKRRLRVAITHPAYPIRSTESAPIAQAGTIRLTH
jgi:hypothetical protein